MEVPQVYKAIGAVAADMAEQGLAKTRTNQQQGYKFRGIDEVMNILAPSMAKHHLIILPRVITRTITERPTKDKQGVLFYVVIECEFDFVSTDDGSKHTVRTFGEAMDSGDKASNKSQSCAFKYAAFQAFCIPTEGDGDADADSCTHEAAAKPAEPQAGSDHYKLADEATAAMDAQGKCAEICPKCGAPAKCNIGELTRGGKKKPAFTCSTNKPRKLDDGKWANDGCDWKEYDEKFFEPKPPTVPQDAPKPAQGSKAPAPAAGAPQGHAAAPGAKPAATGDHYIANLRKAIYEEGSSLGITGLGAWQHFLTANGLTTKLDTVESLMAAKAALGTRRTLMNGQLPPTQDDVPF